MEVSYILFSLTVLVSVNGFEMPDMPGMPDMPSLQIGGDLAGPEVAEAIRSCKQKLQVSAVDIMAITQQEIPKSKSALCLMACVQKEIGIIGPDNRYNLDVIRAKFEPMKTANSDLYELTLQAFEDCIDAGAHERDDCKAYDKLQACMKEKKTDAKETLVDSMKMIG